MTCYFCGQDASSKDLLQHNCGVCGNLNWICNRCSTIHGNDYCFDCERQALVDFDWNDQFFETPQISSLKPPEINIDTSGSSGNDGEPEVLVSRKRSRDYIEEVTVSNDDVAENTGSELCRGGNGITPTENTIARNIFDVGIVTWNLNHGSEKTKEENKGKSAAKGQTIQRIFTQYDWVDILALQEINGSTQIDISSANNLEYIAGPFMKSLSYQDLTDEIEGKMELGKGGKSFLVYENGEGKWATPRQGEYYGIVYRTDRMTYRGCDVFYKTKLSPVDADGSKNFGDTLYWSKEGGDLSDNIPGQNGYEIEVTQLSSSRPVIVYKMEINEPRKRTVNIAVVHTTPGGSKKNRTNEFEQINGLLKYISEDGGYWIFAGDYYLDPQTNAGTMTREETDAIRQQQKKPKLKRLLPLKFEKQLERLKLELVISVSATNQSKLTFTSNKGLLAAIKRLEEKLREIEQDNSDEEEDFMPEIQSKAQENTDSKRKDKEIDFGEDDEESKNDEVDIEVDSEDDEATEEVYIEVLKQLEDKYKTFKEDKLSLEERRMFSEAINKHLQDKVGRGFIIGNKAGFWVVNKRADFFICSSNFTKTYAGLLQPKGKKILEVDPNHKALNWWTSISDHAPVGAVCSINEQSPKLLKVMNDVFDAEHTTQALKMRQKLTSFAFEEINEAIQVLVKYVINQESRQPLGFGFMNEQLAPVDTRIPVIKAFCCFALLKAMEEKDYDISDLDVLVGTDNQMLFPTWKSMNQVSDKDCQSFGNACLNYKFTSQNPATNENEQVQYYVKRLARALNTLQYTFKDYETVSEDISYD